MKLYSRVQPWLLGLMCLLMTGCDLCDRDDDDDGGGGGVVTTTCTYNFTISGECKATDASGAEIAQLDLVAGQTVEYCNRWNARAELKFSIVGFLPAGALNLTLEPGQCVTYVVDSTVVDGEYQWSLSCEGYSGGMGGGPVKVDNPPPGP